MANLRDTERSSEGDGAPRTRGRPADVMIAVAFQIGGYLLALVALLALVDALLSGRDLAWAVAVVAALGAFGLLRFARRLGRH